LARRNATHFLIRAGQTSYTARTVNDYNATSEIDPDSAISFQEDITQAISKSDLRGTRTIKMDTDNGVLWVVME
jgi:hypothetical protein